jgi:hypothetical protein
VVEVRDVAMDGAGGGGVDEVVGYAAEGVAVEMLEVVNDWISLIEKWRVESGRVGWLEGVGVLEELAGSSSQQSQVDSCSALKDTTSEIKASTLCS